jgi:hypothetical protein
VGASSDVIGPTLYKNVPPTCSTVVKLNWNVMSGRPSPSLSMWISYNTPSPNS